MRGATWIYLFGVCLMFVWSRQQHRALLLWIASATPPPKSRRSLARRGAAQILWKYDRYVSIRLVLGSIMMLRPGTELGTEIGSSQLSPRPGSQECCKAKPGRPDDHVLCDRWNGCGGANRGHDAVGLTVMGLVAITERRAPGDRTWLRRPRGS